jgi:hypothetical protein
MVAPETVLSPRNKLEKIVKVLHNGGEDDYSVVKGIYDGEPRIGIRYNGGPKTRPKGYPTDQGQPTWFWLPHDVADLVESALALGSTAPGEGG